MYGLGFAKSRRGPGRPSPRSPRQISRPPTEQCGEADPRGTGWWAVTVSNCRPPGCKPGALPAELTALVRVSWCCEKPLYRLGNILGNRLQILLSNCHYIE